MERNSGGDRLQLESAIAEEITFQNSLLALNLTLEAATARPRKPASAEDAVRSPRKETRDSKGA